jgi:hypothetical protein
MCRVYMCMYYVVLFVCSSTVVQYNSVTRPLSVMHRLSEAKWDVLAQCVCCAVLVLCQAGEGDGEDKTLTLGRMEKPLYSMYHHTLLESIK